MIRIAENAGGIVVADTESSWTEQDRSALWESLARTITTEKQGRLLLAVTGLDGPEVEIDDFWYEVKASAFLKGLTRLAVVTDPAALPELEKLTALSPFPTRIFAVAERGEAIIWLSTFER